MNRTPVMTDEDKERNGYNAPTVDVHAGLPPMADEAPFVPAKAKAPAKKKAKAKAKKK